MLHRAIYGSLERFLSVYIEHTGGAFPAWLAPEQAVVITVSEKQDDYAREVVKVLTQAGLRARADTSSDKLGAKKRAAILQKVPYVLVVGDREAENRQVMPYSYALKKNLGESAMALDAFAAYLREEAKAPALVARDGNAPTKAPS